MTSAHRPTWNAAKASGSTTVSGGYYHGGLASRSRHGRDLPAHTSLKYRGDGVQALHEARAAHRLKRGECGQMLDVTRELRHITKRQPR